MKHTKRKSYVKDKQYDKDYKGEESPYNQYMQNVFATKNGNSGGVKEYQELPEANPDVLCESDGLYYHKINVDETELEMVERAWPLLTKKQQQALELVGLEGKTLENAGAIMGINKSNVLDLIKRARKIIKTNSKNF